MRSKIVKSAWLITWESNRNDEKVASVLKYQKSDDQISKHIIQLYVDSLYPSEKISFLKNQGATGLSEQLRTSKVRGKTTFSIGREPYLYGRRVKNLKIKNGQLVWDE